MHTRAHEDTERNADALSIARVARAAIQNAEAGTPLAALAQGEELREQTADAIARVVTASTRDVPGDTRIRRLLRRTDAIRVELSRAEFALAEAWRTGDRQAATLRAVARLRLAVEERHARLLETPEGLLAAKEADLERYADELRRTRFALTASREEAVHQLLRAVVQGRPVLMLGPSGTGKTTVVRELARRLGVDDPEIIPGNEVTSGQLWGTRGLDPVKGDVIRDGIVARAMVGGKLLLWDEANASDEAMEKFLKFKAYLTTRPGDLVRVPPEHPDQRAVHPKFAFLLTGNPKSEKNKTRAEFPPEVARELSEVTLDYLPEEELYDLCLASLADGGTIPLASEELKADGPLHALVKMVSEVQRLYLGKSEARGTATTATLRRLVIDPGMVTAWLQGWAFDRASAGVSLASFLDRELVGLARSEKYPAEDRAILAQTANRFRFLATPAAKRALAASGLNAAALSGSPFPKALYAADRAGETSFAEAAALHPYLQKQLDTRFVQLLKTVGERAGMDEDTVRSALIGTNTSERISELRALAALDSGDLRERLGQPRTRPPRGSRMPRRSTDKRKEGELTLQELSLHLRLNGLDKKLENGSLGEQVQTFARAFADGGFGFQLDTNALAFPKDKLPALEVALLRGAVNGVVVTAYPTREQVDAIAAKTGESVNVLLDMPVTEFLVRHFENKGGTVDDRENRLAKWRTLRWPTDGPLALPSAHRRLPGQPRLRDVLGYTQLSFTNTAQDVALATPILQSAPPGDPKHIRGQGEFLSYERLVAAGASILAPDEWLAMASTSDPEKIRTYPSRNTWDFLSGVEPSGAAYGRSLSNGLNLRCVAPENSGSNGRARSVVRGTPRFRGLQSESDVDATADEDADSTLEVPASWGVDELRQWLTTEGIESRLDGGSLEHWIAKAEAAYADGALGFRLDRARIRFEATAEKLAHLKNAIVTGSITGAVVEAYPTEADLAKPWGKPVRSADELMKLRDMPITEFLAEHFAARGGTLYEWPDRIREWRTLRWATDGGETIGARIVFQTLVRGLIPGRWTAKDGSLTQTYKNIHEAVYEALPPQPKVKDRLGQATLAFTNVNKEVPQTTTLLRSDGSPSIVSQGDGLSFIQILRNEVSLISPTEFLALASVLSDPKIIGSYIDLRTWEWFDAITASCAAVGDSVSVGLDLCWNVPECSISNGRARPVVR